MSYGIQVRDHKGVLVEDLENMSMCVGVVEFALNSATSGNVTLPNCNYVVVQATNGGVPVSHTLTSSTTLSWSRPASTGTYNDSYLYYGAIQRVICFK